MEIRLNKTITQNFDAGISREWLETNGLGGWASSTIIGAHTRRYHGLLVAATKPPVGRMVILSKLDEIIEISGHRFELGTNVYSGTVHPQGYKFLLRFTKGLFPVFEYDVSGIKIKKTISAVHGENTTLIIYEILDAPAGFSFELLPLVAGRDYHGLVKANDAINKEISFHDGLFHARPYKGVPDFYIRIQGAEFNAMPDWYYSFEYPEEKNRGLDFREDLFCYGIFKLSLKKGDKVAVIISTQDPAGKDAFKMYDLEKDRRLNLFSSLPKQDDFSKILALAADQFVVKRGESLRTIIAGYHWFTDWGRDTMISIPGITLVTGRFDDAKKILRSFAESTSQGMLPNRYPDIGEKPEYNTIDATLWFFVAVYKYLQYTDDKGFVCSELMPVLEDIIHWHDKGTRFNIRTDGDALLSGGMPGIQLTWMDAKAGDWVITPRLGKAVEVNALWYNALKISAYLSMCLNNCSAASKYERRAIEVRREFNKVFWNREQQCLFDYVDGNSRDAAIRPNQIFALSLPFPLLSMERSKSVLRVVEKRLLTPYGLRTLTPDHPDYNPRYEGDRFSRDSAYHQGTVWGWLIGPFLDALVRIKGAVGKKQARPILKNMARHFKDAGIGTISEIFDGNAPYKPRGCIAQAWSVSEVFRAYIEHV
ncbi:MAG: amylo-alpha-1,6-glucosidase [bacterium]